MHSEMSRNNLPLSSVLTDVATAIASTQREMDKLANESTGSLPFAPLAFVIKRTELTLLGSLFMRSGVGFPATDSALSFALPDRVQAGLRGSQFASLSSRISVSIQAVDP